MQSKRGDLVDLRRFIRDVPDFPKKGIVFKDITPVLQDATTFTRIVGALESYGRKRGTELVVIPDAAHLLNIEAADAVNQLLLDHLGGARPSQHPQG